MSKMPAIAGQGAAFPNAVILSLSPLSIDVSTYVAVSRIAGLSELTQDEIDIRILTHEEEAALIGPMSDRPHDLEERAMLICGLDTLQRLGSVTTLTWSHDKGTDFRILNAKVRSGTGAGKVIPISTRLRAALDAIESPRGPHAPLFPLAASDVAQNRRNAVGRFFNAAMKFLKSYRL